MRPLYGAREPSLSWRGGFYVLSPGSLPWTLRLEYEGHEHTNRVELNGQTVGYLPRQTWADMWMSAALPIPADLLRVGYNELVIEVGRAHPACQVRDDSWDELLFRRVRLERAAGEQPIEAAPATALVTITVVYDNNATRPGVGTAWGFGCVIEAGDRKVLFDTGGDGQVLLANMAALGIDAKDLDTVVLSHAHDDHTGGLEALLEANPDVTVYVPQAFSTGFKDRVRTAGARLLEVAEPIEIVPGLWSTGQIGGAVIEQALVVQTGSGLAVITGCAHPGILEMVAQARAVGRGEVSMVMGGFHLVNANDSALQEIIAGLRAAGVTRVVPCHCSGQAATQAFAAEFGEDSTPCGVGLVIAEEESEHK